MNTFVHKTMASDLQFGCVYNPGAGYAHLVPESATTPIPCSRPALQDF